MFSSHKSQSRPVLLTMLGIAAMLLISLAGNATQAATSGASAVEKVTVLKDTNGMKLQVAGRDFMVFGMNWGYMPIGENYSYDFWGQPDEFIETALATEMPMLQNMGVNCIRQYAGIPPRWVEYIWKNYGIYTVLNHPVARWGFTLDGVWHANTDYSNPKLREAVKAEIFALVEEFKDTPGVLMWLLGNENNYGIWWSSFEIENLPKGDQNATRARFLYSLMGEIIDGIKERDDLRPVSMANGDIQYLDIIAEECKNMDIFGTNQYRGISVGDMNQRVKDAMNIPLVYTEFGADAFNAKTMSEDQPTQAKYLIGQWQEIYERSYGKGQEGNHIGGMIFQWADGWWKFRQEERLDIHDTNASWANGAYREDFTEDGNNMNEEWWGICAKGRNNSAGYFELYPRAAYYALAKAFKLDPYAPDTDVDLIRKHFSTITPGGSMLEAKGDRAALMAAEQQKIRVSSMRMEFETFSTGGTVNTIGVTPDVEPGSVADQARSYPSFMGFDNMESYYVGFEAKPSSNFIANLELNILGNVADNPLDEIFYENRGRKKEIIADGEPILYEGLDRLRVYQASFSWDEKWFEMQGFYRTGHLHWGFEGDFFGLYRNAFYGENVDIYNGVAPQGVEVAGKRSLNGLKVAAGPQLWWGANPAVFMKYQRQVGKFELTGIAQEDVAAGKGSVTSSVQPVAEARKASLQAVTQRGKWTIEGGTLWAGSRKVGDSFDLYDDETGSEVVIRTDNIKDEDTFGFKGKVSWQSGAWRWYAQGAYMGLVADAGPNEVITFTGWKLEDSGSGNQKNVITGFTYNKGNWQVGPNLLWQKPIVGPIPGDAPDPGAARNLNYDPATGKTTDPFAVLGNRETRGVEILFTYDPHPATWFYAWDNDRREGAKFAFNLGYVFKDLPTTRDAHVFYHTDGITRYAFSGAAPAHTEWEVHSKIVSKLGAETRLVANIYGGMAEPNGWVNYGVDPAELELEERRVNSQVNRIIHRYGADARLVHKSLALQGMVKFNDWGVYDYHRDWGLTFPMQLMGEVSWSLGTPKWFGEPETRIGFRGLYRTLDQNSNRYHLPEDWENYPSWEAFQDAVDLAGDGTEWEFRTFLHVSI